VPISSKWTQFPAVRKKLSILEEGDLMGRKLSLMLIVMGSLLMLLGLTFLASGLSQSRDESISGVGICTFSLGALICATGVYLRARAAQATVPANPKPQAQPKARGGCDLCGVESPAVMCRVHQLHLCPNCLAKHYDTRSCIYVPSTRRAPAARAARA